jgi:uncharacterized membrane protein YjfL (UPF0719 family)
LGAWEPLAGIASVVVSIRIWVPWYLDIVRVNRTAALSKYRLVLGVTPIVCLLLLLLCLERFAAKEVRESDFYVLVYMAIGAGSLGISSQIFPFLGVSARDEDLERRNSASAIAVTGALLGASFCFAGGNIGEGPGVEAVAASAGAAIGVWFFFWYSLEVLSGRRLSERITVERDVGSGVRLAGLLVANGLIIGAAAAGDWIPSRFLHDFALSAWPALVLTVAAITVESVSRVPSAVWRSALTVSAYVVVAIWWLVHQGLGA